MKLDFKLSISQKRFQSINYLKIGMVCFSFAFCSLVRTNNDKYFVGFMSIWEYKLHNLNIAAINMCVPSRNDEGLWTKVDPCKEPVPPNRIVISPQIFLKSTFLNFGKKFEFRIIHTEEQRNSAVIMKILSHADRVDFCRNLNVFIVAIKNY